MKMQLSWKWFGFSLLLLVVVYLLLYFYADLAISEFAEKRLDLQGSKLIAGFNELCGHMEFVILVCALLLVYCGAHGRILGKKVLFVAVTILVAAVILEALKCFFGRARPMAYFDHGIYGMQWFKTKDIFHSTPSGHSTRAMALCMSLALLCRRRWLQAILLAFALMQALCRVVLLRHYLSDVLFGLWLGGFIALYVYSVMFPRGVSEADNSLIAGK